MEAISQFDNPHCRCVECAIHRMNHFYLFGLLTVLSNAQNHYVLTTHEFHDALALCRKLPSEDTGALIADLDARGVWQLQSMTLLKIHVVDTDAMSYLSHSPAAVLASAEAEKNKINVLPLLIVMLPLHLCVF